MNGPRLDGWRFLCACMVGVVTGLVYGSVRPLRRHHPVLGDLLFFPVMFYAWLYVSFAICRGDIRLGYTAGLFVGGILWEMTAGKWLRPVFDWMWKLIFRIFSLFFLPFKKFLKIFCKNVKKLFALWKKWFTIIWTIRRHSRQQTGGAPIGKEDPLL